MSNGSPALAGTPMTDPKSAAGQLANNGPNDKQPGVNGTTAGDTHVTARNQNEEAEVFKFTSVKGSKVEYVYGARFDITLGWKHTVTAGYKTGIDIAYNRSNNYSKYLTFYGGIRYEIITPKKTEHVIGKKDDTALGKKFERVEGVSTHKGPSEQKKQAMSQEIVDTLMQELGTELDQKVAKLEANWDKVSKEADTMKQQSQKVDDKITQLCVSIKNYKADIKTINDICKEFERKASQMEIAADSALEIKSAKTSIKGAIIGMKAGTLKLMGDLVKLGQ